MDGYLNTSFVYLDNVIDMLNFKFRVDSLREHVVSDVQNINVTCTLSVSEKGSLNTVSSGKQGKLGAGNACTSVIMRVNA